MMYKQNKIEPDKKTGRYTLFLGCNKFKKDFNHLPKYCDHTEPESPCPKCLGSSRVGALVVSWETNIRDEKKQLSQANF